jgi:hypothetical protein
VTRADQIGLKSQSMMKPRWDFSPTGAALPAPLTALQTIVGTLAAAAATRFVRNSFPFLV